MKTAYAITVGGEVEDIVLTDSYDEAEEFVKKNWWDGRAPRFDGDRRTPSGEEIGIYRATLSQPIDEPGPLQEQIETFLTDGLYELKCAAAADDEARALYWIGQAQVGLAVIASRLMR